MTKKMNKKGAVLLPESQLTDEELDKVAGGLLPAFEIGTSIGVKQLPGLPMKPSPIFERPAMPIAAGCDTGDSGAMGCPG